MKLTNKASVKGVIAAMSLEDKLWLLQSPSMFKTKAFPEYGIPATYMLDGSTGMNFRQTTLEAINNIRTDGKRGISTLSAIPGFDQRESLMEYLTGRKNPQELPEDKQDLVERLLAEIRPLVPDLVLPGCFPPGILLASGWDKENIYNTGVALGKECHYYNLDILLGSPNVNIHRDPLNGRLFEGYSEDPCLTAELAPEMVKGIQSEGVSANVKHYAANNQETNRRSIDEKIQERTMREIYLPGFKACIDAGCDTVMSAYNLINGVPCAHNGWLLNTVLRDEWGFEGYVMSDWGGVYDQVDALNAGNDLQMPASEYGIDKLLEAVADGRLTEQTIDRAVENILNQIIHSLAMKGRKYDSIDRECSRKAAYESAKEGIILLKNEEILPLAADTGVCFFGEKSLQFAESGAGSANVITDQGTSLYQEMGKILGENHISYQEPLDNAKVAVITVGSRGSEGFDRKQMDLDPPDKEMLLKSIAVAKAKNLKIILILNVCGPVDMREYIDDVDAILCIFYPGMEGGRVVARMLMGQENPSGKLPITFPKRYEDCPSSIYFPGRNMETWYGEGIFVGYRWYDYRQIEPLYPFGHGLSYTTFELSGAALATEVFTYDNQKSMDFTVNIRNTGRIYGKEVIQVYIGQENSTLVKPVKELKTFQKVGLAPGEEKTVTFSITRDMLQSFDEELNQWTVEPGTYYVYIGNSSRNISHVLTFQAEGTNSFGFGKATPLDKLVTNPEAFALMQSYCPEGSLTVQEILAWVMFQKAPTVDEFWQKTVVPTLDPATAEATYKELLKKLNKYTTR